jgi:hypothetical protein
LRLLPDPSRASPTTVEPHQFIEPEIEPNAVPNGPLFRAVQEETPGATGGDLLGVGGLTSLPPGAHLTGLRACLERLNLSLVSHWSSGKAVAACTVVAMRVGVEPTFSGHLSTMRTVSTSITARFRVLTGCLGRLNLSPVSPPLMSARSGTFPNQWKKKAVDPIEDLVPTVALRSVARSSFGPGRTKSSAIPSDVRSLAAFFTYNGTGASIHRTTSNHEPDRVKARLARYLELRPVHNETPPR